MYDFERVDKTSRTHCATLAHDGQKWFFLLASTRVTRRSTGRQVITRKFQSTCTFRDGMEPDTRSSPRNKLHLSASTVDLHGAVSTLKRRESCISLPHHESTPATLSSTKKYHSTHSTTDLHSHVSMLTRKERSISISDCDRSVLMSSAALPWISSPSCSFSSKEMVNIPYNTGLAENTSCLPDARSIDTPALSQGSSDVSRRSTNNLRCEANISLNSFPMNFSELSHSTHIDMELIYPQNPASHTIGRKSSVIDSSIESSGHTPTKPATYSPEFSRDNERVGRLTCFCSKEASNSKHTCLCLSKRSGGLITSKEQDMNSACSLSSMDHQKQNNKRVRFTTVKVYYFARTQGISTVPKSGEVSLGMVDKHFTERQFSLWPGHRPELKLTNESEEELSGTCSEYPERFDSERHERSTAYQLQLVEGKARIKMLKRSGVQVRKDESLESLESIRQSRILCGCHCENGVCLFDTCQCALEGIVCQVDGVDEFGMAHPCWCNAMSCSNPCGRTEFDPEHVRNHYQMTMMRLKHAEKTGVYDIPLRIRFNSDGEPQPNSEPCASPSEVTTHINIKEPIVQQLVDKGDPPTPKFPVTPVFKKSKQKRGLRVKLAEDHCSTGVSKLKRRFS